MTQLFILLYSITLVYFVVSERVKKFIWLLVIQGVILFGIAISSLDKLEIYELAFILFETILVKSIFIPWFLNRVRKHNHLKRENETYISVFYSIIIVMIIILLSFIISNYLNDIQLHTQYFTIAFASIIFGIYFIIIHKNIFSHLVGYLIIENGIFLLSLSVGNTMPIMVSLAVLLDVFLGVLILGTFINHIGNTFNSIEIDNLSNLKD